MPEEPLSEFSKEGTGFTEKGGISSPAGSPESLPVPPDSASEQKEERLEGKYLEILQKTSPAAPATLKKDEEAAVTAKAIGALTDEDAKVTRLLELAEHKGVTEAVKVAYALKDYYVLDRMHDDLADKLYEGLKEKGLVPKE